jgi:5-methylcytosine-specific restriction endonuclease McrA
VSINAQSKPTPKLLDKRATKAQQDREWWDLRNSVLLRDSFVCRACGGRAGLDVHHLLRRSLGGKDERRNLITLCRRCHQDVHGHVLMVRWTDDHHRAKTVRFERGR